MSVYKLQIHTADDNDTITRADFASLLKSAAWHIENFPHRNPGVTQDLHDKNEVRIGEYLVVARFEEPKD